MSSAIDEGFSLSFWLKKNVTSQKIEGGASIRVGAFIRRNTVGIDGAVKYRVFVSVIKIIQNKLSKILFCKKGKTYQKSR